MSSIACSGALSAPSVNPEALQRRRIAARASVSSAVAGVLALHAYGQPRDAIVLVAIADAGTLIGEVRR